MNRALLVLLKGSQRCHYNKSLSAFTDRKYLACNVLFRLSTTEPLFCLLGISMLHNPRVLWG